jgi:hypothetical protein
VDGGAHRRGALGGDETEVRWTAASGEVEKWPNSLSQLERYGDKAGLDGHTQPALRRQRGHEVVGGHAVVVRARRQRPGDRLNGADTDKWAFGLI